MTTQQTRDNVLQMGTGLFCDFYHPTMAQTWFNNNKANEIKTSEVFFRKYPFSGSYVMNAGLAEFMQYLQKWKFSQKDIEYLRKQNFSERFLKFLQEQKLQISINAAPEGELLFANEPVYSITGPSWQVEIFEAALLNIFNSQSLVATQASRIVYAATKDGKNRPVLEFGLRRAPELACFSQTRAAFIGGLSATSNVAAARYYNIPVSGTMAHSFVMSYQNEVDAFKDFMRSNPDNSILLVDTYDTERGIKNAIEASKQTQIPLKGIRIDSGNLAELGKKAQKLLDQAKKENPQLFGNVNLIASNDLDEYAIDDLINIQKAPYNTLAVGTKLVTGYDTPSLGGIFKTKEYNGHPCIKIAPGKTTIPYATNVVRVMRDNKFYGDIICHTTDKGIIENGKLARDIISYDMNGNHKTYKKGDTAYFLLQPIMVNGKLIHKPETDLRKIQQYGRRQLTHLDESCKQLHNPSTYPVGMENHVHASRQRLINQARQSNNAKTY